MNAQVIPLQPKPDFQAIHEATLAVLIASGRCPKLVEYWSQLWPAAAAKVHHG